MQKQRISRRGLEVSRIGLGCVTFGREIDEAQSFRVLDYAFEHGINLLDTAEGYGGGQAQAYRRSRGIVEPAEPAAEMHSSEKIIGRWLKSNGLRSQVVLQTKIARNFTRQHLPDALDASLERLQTGYVEIYLFHSYDPGTPMEEAMTAMTRPSLPERCMWRASRFQLRTIDEGAAAGRPRTGRPSRRLSRVQPGAAR